MLAAVKLPIQDLRSLGHTKNAELSYGYPVATSFPCNIVVPASSRSLGDSYSSTPVQHEPAHKTGHTGAEKSVAATEQKTPLWDPNRMATTTRATLTFLMRR